MGDRTSATISIGGVLRGDDAVQTLVDTVVAEGAGDNYEAADAGEVEAMIREAAANGRPVHFSATEVNYGSFDEIETTCTELGLSFIASWESGGDYSAGVKHYDPTRGTIEFAADSDGHPLASLDEIVKANADGTIEDLIANMRRCTTETLPPITVEEVTDAGGERDDDHAIMPDGTRVEQWDERLRAAGARRVRKDYQEPAVWTPADSAAAVQEGWDVFNCDGEMQVQRCDEHEILPDDDAAWKLVAEGTRRGSPLHAKALAAVSAEERAKILAANPE